MLYSEGELTSKFLNLDLPSQASENPSQLWLILAWH